MSRPDKLAQMFLAPQRDEVFRWELFAHLAQDGRVKRNSLHAMLAFNHRQEREVEPVRAFLDQCLPVMPSLSPFTDCSLCEASSGFHSPSPDFAREIESCLCVSILEERSGSSFGVSKS